MIEWAGPPTRFTASGSQSWSGSGYTIASVTTSATLMVPLHHNRARDTVP